MLNFGKRIQKTSVKDAYPYPALILSPREEGKNANISFSQKAIKSLEIVQKSDAEKYRCYVTIAKDDANNVFIAAIEEDPKEMHVKRVQRGKAQVADSYMHDTICEVLGLDNSEENVVALVEAKSIVSEEEIDNYPSSLHDVLKTSKWFNVMTMKDFDAISISEAPTTTEVSGEEAFSQSVSNNAADSFINQQN